MLATNPSMEMVHVKLLMIADVVNVIDRLLTSPVPIFTKRAESDTQLLSSHALLPTNGCTVASNRPEFRPPTVTIIAPVLGVLVLER